MPFLLIANGYMISGPAFLFLRPGPLTMRGGVRSWRLRTILEPLFRYTRPKGIKPSLLQSPRTCSGSGRAIAWQILWRSRCPTSARLHGRTLNVCAALSGYRPRFCYILVGSCRGWHNAVSYHTAMLQSASCRPFRRRGTSCCIHLAGISGASVASALARIASRRPAGSSSSADPIESMSCQTGSSARGVGHIPFDALSSCTTDAQGSPPTPQLLCAWRKWSQAGTPSPALLYGCRGTME